MPIYFTVCAVSPHLNTLSSSARRTRDDDEGEDTIRVCVCPQRARPPLDNILEVY